MKKSINEIRSSVFYKLCGFICGILTILSIFVYNATKLFYEGEAALLVLPLLFISVVILFLDFIVFIVLTILASFLRNRKEQKVNIVADIGYVLTLCFLIFAFIMIYLF